MICTKDKKLLTCSDFELSKNSRSASLIQIDYVGIVPY